MIAPGMGIGLTGLGGNNSSSGSKGNNNNYLSNNNSNNNVLHTGSRAGGLASASAGGAGVATTLFSSEGSSKPPNTYKFDTNGTLWALSASPDFSMVAVVGRDGELKASCFGLRTNDGRFYLTHSSLIILL